MNDILLLVIVLAIIPIAASFLLFISWLIAGLAKAGDVSMGFLEWSKAELLSYYRSTRARVAILNPSFHFILLGLVVKPIFIPDLPSIHWLLLIVMVMLLDPIASYFYGWDMWFKNCIPADAPKPQRFIAFIMMATLYVFVFMDWFGGMERWNESTGPS